MFSSRKPLLVGLAALAWCFGVILLYYVSHKPVTPDLALALAKVAWEVIVVLGLASLAGAIGSLIFGDSPLDPLAGMALQAGLGFGVLSLSILLVGNLFGLPRLMLWLAPPIGLAILFRQVRAWWQKLTRLSGLWQDAGRFSQWVAAMIGLLVFCSLLVALAPPLKFDSLVYHLVLPDAYLRDGRVSYLPWHVMTGMPQNAEMLYTWAIALGGNSAATALSWSFGLLALLGLLGYLRQRLDVASAWAGAACLMAGFTVVMVMGWGYVDWLVVLVSLGTLVCLDGWRQTGGKRWLILAGVFTGLAIGTKYTSGVLALTGTGALCWHIWKRKEKFFPAILTFGILATLVALPWFLKNWITTGNPVYPFFFPAGAVTPVRIQVYQNLVPWGNWLDLFLLPLRATYLGQDSGDGYMASIGPLLAGLGALVWLGWRKFSLEQRAALENAAIMALVCWLIWGVGNRLSGNLIQTRYYFSVFPAFAALGAAGYWAIRRLEVPHIRLGMIVSGLIILVLGLNLLEVGVDVLKQGTLQVILGIKTEQSYLADNLGWYQPAMQAVSELPEGTTTQLLFEPRSLYCAPRCKPDEILDRWKRDRAALHDAQAIRQAWLKEGITHVLFYRTGADFLVEANDPHHTPEDLQALKDFLNTLPPPVDFGGVYQLYSIQ
jgi:hypothetical protein